MMYAKKVYDTIPFTHLEKGEAKNYISPHQIDFAIDVVLSLTVKFGVRSSTPTLQSQRPRRPIYLAMAASL